MGSSRFSLCYPLRIESGVSVAVAKHLSPSLPPEETFSVETSEDQKEVSKGYQHFVTRERERERERERVGTKPSPRAQVASIAKAAAYQPRVNNSKTPSRRGRGTASSYNSFTRRASKRTLIPTILTSPEFPQEGESSDRENRRGISSFRR